MAQGGERRDLFRSSQRLQIGLALAAVYIIWGSTYLAIRFVVGSIPPLLAMGGRFLLAGSILYIFVRLRGEARPTAANWRAAAIVGLLLLLGGNGVVAWSERVVPSGLAALLVSTTPIWIAVVDWLHPGGERPSLLVSIGLALGFLGVVLLIWPNLMSGGTTLHTSGPLAAISLIVIPVASLSWALGSVYSRGAPMPKSPLLGTGMEMLAGGVGMIIVGVVSGELAHLHLQDVSIGSVVAFCYLVIFGSLVAFTAYVWLLRSAPLSVASTYAYVNPAVAVFLGWAFGDGQLSTLTVVAAAIIVGAVGIITTARSPRSAARVRGRAQRRLRRDMCPEDVLHPGTLPVQTDVE